MSGSRRRRRGEPLTLAEVVAELTVKFWDPGDRPREHACTPRCQHQVQSLLPLLDRVRWLVPASQELVASDTPRGGRSPGSPAPWSAGPAELLDEVERAALDLDSRMRRLLGFGELPVHVPPTYRIPTAGPRCRGLCPHRSCLQVRASRWRTVPASSAPASLAGRAALLGLPTLLEFLSEQRPQSPLVRGRLIDPDRPRAGYRWGEVESTVRGWHRRALEMTGHEAPDPIVREMRNPVFGQYWPGPLCEAQTTDRGCLHQSCLRAWFAADTREWMPPECPHCRGRTLPQDQDTGVLYCDRPGCVEPVTGRRPEWSLEAFRAWGLQLDSLTEPTREGSCRS